MGVGDVRQVDHGVDRAQRGVLGRHGQRVVLEVTVKGLVKVCFPGELGTNSADCTPNPQSVIDAITIDVFRKGETTLALADFKVSRPDLFTLWAGDVGFATGVEWRRETFIDEEL